MNTIAHPLERELLDALRDARAGDRDAFATLVALTQGMVTAVALAITGDRASSEDIAQETYLEAWRRLPSLGDTLNPAPWLREVARNKAIDLLRRRRLQPVATMAAAETAAELMSSTEGPSEALEQSQRQNIAWSALQALATDQREAVLLYYREGSSSERAAGLLGISESALRKRLQRARDQMRQDIEQQISCYASETAPGVGFGASVLAALATVTQPASAAGSALAAHSAAKSGLAKLSAALGSMFAAIGVVVLAVLIDTRMHMARAQSSSQRRQLIRHGVVYAGLMAGYMVALGWSSRAGIDRGWVFGIALLVSVLIFVLTYWRQRILHQGDTP